jgi:photosystem II stability/assembly factor-like uncharacterized protein
MRRLKTNGFYLLIALSLISTSMGTAAEAEKFGPWKLVGRSEIKHSCRYAAFMDDTFGIGAGCSGVIQYTSDGGKSWRSSYNPSCSDCRYSLDLIDRKTAWQCGSGNRVGLTTDGGKNWKYVADFGWVAPDHCRFLSFIDAKTGWIASLTKLGATVNSGNQWSEILLPQNIKKIAAVTLQTAKLGYLIDTSGTLFTTQNGGETWSSRSLGLKGEELPINNAPLAAIRFKDTNHGLVVIYRSNRQIWAFLTADGGLTWQRERVPTRHGGFIYLAHDGKTLTIFALPGQITVFCR